MNKWNKNTDIMTLRKKLKKSIGQKVSIDSPHKSRDLTQFSPHTIIFLWDSEG